MYYRHNKMKTIISFCTLIFVCISISYNNGQENNNILNVTGTTNSIKPITSYAYQISGFNNNVIKSGPILIIDKKTIFIPNLNYVDSYSQVHFWTGIGNSVSSGILVPDENNSTGSLKAYNGQNIYLQLPGVLTSDKIDYLAIWSMESKTDLGHVLLYPNDTMRKIIPEALGFHNRTAENKTIFRVPKCCPHNSVLGVGGCNTSDTEVKVNYQVIESNETHIDPDRFMNNIEFLPYEAALRCKPGSEPIPFDDTDEVGFIFNASIIYYIDRAHHGILSHGEFCIDSRNETYHIFLICYSSVATHVSASMLNVYFAFLVISTFCFCFSAICYIFILKARDVHRKCFIGYSSSMTITFLTLIFLEKLNHACNFIGSLFILSMLCSFIWLTCLCIDLIYVVKAYSRYSDETRLYYYFGCSLVIPIIFLISSLASDGIPDVPKSFVKMGHGENGCKFGDANIGLFFAPIGVLIFVCLFSLGYTSYIIKTQKDINDSNWIPNRSRYKFMMRSCCLVCITTLIWLLEALVYLENIVFGFEVAINIIEAAQGIFVACIFVLNKYTRKEILKKFRTKENRQDRERRYNELVDRLKEDEH